MTNRQMIYIPELFPNTFVLFYYMGDENGRSYSLRDYSRGGSPTLWNGSDLPWSANEVLRRARHKFSVGRTSTRDCEYWQAETLKLNKIYLANLQRTTGQQPSSASPSPSASVALSSEIPEQPQNNTGGQYPVLAEAALRSHPVKANKTGDMNRILTSPVSEDYVTWNVTQLLLESAPERWWPGLLKLALEDAPHLDLAYDPSDCPTLHLWRKYPAPRAYEQRSRERMARSGNPAWEERSLKAGPVEGESEIDFLAEGKTFLLFVEAKLTSDISERTTYDPARNQIIRNIDVLLDACGSRKPVFWMLVKEKETQSRFMQTIQRYRGDPATLAADLPHRDPQILRRVVQNIAVLRWRDILALLPLDDHRPAVREVMRRVDTVYAAAHPPLVLTPAPTPALTHVSGKAALRAPPLIKRVIGLLWIVWLVTIPCWLGSFLYWMNTNPPAELSQVVGGVIIVLAILSMIPFAYLKRK